MSTTRSEYRRGPSEVATGESKGLPLLMVPTTLLAIITDLNKVRRVKIYTIGIGEADVTLMTSIAQQNDGTFTPVK